MGPTPQRRLARKLDLEMLLSQIRQHPNPKPELEQYTIPADVAASILYMAAYVNDDVEERAVLDLGCGTGRLALGAAFLGAKQVVGVDIDRVAVKTALSNSARAGLKQKTQWIASDIDAIVGRFDTVLQNPPFGVQKRGADRRFLEKALKIGNVVYSLHKSMDKSGISIRKPKTGDYITPVSPSPFLARFIKNREGRIRAVYAVRMTIPHMFSFHRKRKHEFSVHLYVVESGGRR